jgi:uncharacterized protein DUF3108
MTPPPAPPLCRPVLLPLAWILVLAAAPAPPPDSTGTAKEAVAATAAEPAPAAATAEQAVGAAPVTSSLTPVPWKVGEYFQFSIDWNGLNGGSSLMQVQNLTRMDGHRVYRVVMKAESNSFVSKFYKVRDRAETYIDAESLYTRRFVKKLREGGYEKDIDVRFDQEARKAKYADGEVFDVPPGVHDVLSAFYYVRTVPLPTGATLSIPTHDNKKSYEMVVKVHKRERVEVPAGKFDCVLVEPMLKSEGVFKSKGSILVWLSDDARRIPVLVKSKIPVGSVSVSLTDLRLAFEGAR